MYKIFNSENRKRITKNSKGQIKPLTKHKWIKTMNINKNHEGLKSETITV